MIFLAATADDRWMGSMTMEEASENLEVREVMEKLGEEEEEEEDEVSLEKQI